MILMEQVVKDAPKRRVRRDNSLAIDGLEVIYEF
jgi:hypothetical protein